MIWVGVRTRSQLVRLVLNKIVIRSSTASRESVGHGTRGTTGERLGLALLATVVFAATSYAQGSAPPPSSSSESQQIGKILSVRKVLPNQYFGSRYPQMHYYLLSFALRTSNQTYCDRRGTLMRLVFTDRGASAKTGTRAEPTAARERDRILAFAQSAARQSLVFPFRYCPTLFPQ